MDKICSVCGSKTNVINYKRKTLLCSKHRTQMIVNGEILNRTRFDENEINVNGDIAEITIYDRNGNKKEEKVVIDVNCIEKVKKFRWWLDGRGYANTRVDGKTIKMHRLLMGEPEGYDIDHRNCNKIDNRIKNLRKCTNGQNSLNKGIRSNNTSGIKGVSWDNNHNAWRTFISVDRKRIELGYRKDINVAIALRKEAEVKYHGEFAYQG